jgi:putative ABC transport system permease protein
MITHLFKLIWNKKKQNFLIMLELFFSFLVLFAIFSLIFNYYQSFRQPRGFDHTDILVIKRGFDPSSSLTLSQSEDSNDTLSERKDSSLLREQIIKQQIKSLAQVKAVSYASPNTPYSSTNMGQNVTYGRISTYTDMHMVEDSYAGLLNMKMERGRWFTKDDITNKYVSAVINTKLKEKLFGEEDALNKVFTAGSENYRVIGVIQNSKDKSDYSEPVFQLFRRADSSFYKGQTILVKLKQGADANFEAKLFKTLMNVTQGTSIEITHLDDMRKSKNNNELIPLIVISIVVVFFIINVALGLFGVLWFNINKRKEEIGLRRAIGATKNGISKQLVAEALVLTTISIIIGLFFAIQFPLLNIFDLTTTTYVAAIGSAILFIYLLVIICAIYPGKQAAAIYPAIALHEQ